MSEITRILAREVLDSRGNPTVEVELHSGTASASAIVPSGASTGKNEALELRDGGKRFLGKGVRKAVDNIKNIITPKILGLDCAQQHAIDKMLVELDGTENKSRLGANAILGVSMATAKLAAAVQNKHLFEYLNGMFDKNGKFVLPCPQLNVINGGKHAGSSLAIQECMIIPHKAQSFSDALRMSVEIYHHMKGILKSAFGHSAVNVGDEGGFVPQITNVEQALDIILSAIEQLGYQEYFGLGLDCAASSFFINGKYALEGGTFSSDNLLDFYSALIGRFPIISIEDPFHEDDFDAFATLTRAHGSKMQVVGDDLLTTNIKRINKALEEKSCNALLLKVNQIGTLIEAMNAAKLAMQSGWNVIVSHRSGETEDAFIADMAVALCCGQIKTGAPARGERTAKYNRLLRVEEILGTKARYGKW